MYSRVDHAVEAFQTGLQPAGATATEKAIHGEELSLLGHARQLFGCGVPAPISRPRWVLP